MIAKLVSVSDLLFHRWTGAGNFEFEIGLYAVTFNMLRVDHIILVSTLPEVQVFMVIITIYHYLINSIFLLSLTTTYLLQSCIKLQNKQHLQYVFAN